MFLDMKDKSHMKFGGIMLDDGNLICACCGRLFEKDERGETWDILEEYDYWPDMTEFILS